MTWTGPIDVYLCEKHAKPFTVGYSINGIEFVVPRIADLILKPSALYEMNRRLFPDGYPCCWLGEEVMAWLHSEWLREDHVKRSTAAW